MAVAFRVDPDKTAPARPRLNDSQQEILRLLAEGLSNKEIASRIHLSENTVKTHIQEILRRLEVRNRVQAAVRATKERWVQQAWPTGRERLLRNPPDRGYGRFGAVEG